ncbi:MAG: methyltransferase domain-containing protein, partial [Ferruginibacter sp.]
DVDNENAKAISNNCKALIKKEGIKLELTHDFLEEKELLDFLAKNDINVFLYKDKDGRGISSVIDYALAVKKPIAVSNSPMFRHIIANNPTICITNFSLKEILKKGFQPLESVATDWDKTNILWEYERILDTIFSQNLSKQKFGKINTIKNIYKKALSIPNSSFSWLRDTDSATKDNLTFDNTLKYTPVINENIRFKYNRILDDSARILYEPTISLLTTALPKTMAKKIARANVQQAFVFDTVYRNLINYINPKLLCVGSYEDTASMLLTKMGVAVEEIDPMINYFLQDYYTKPTTKKASYDIIFSTSVIEHDPDDKSFLECIEGLLKPGGIAVITCDYKDGWVSGQPKPDVDARLYTKKCMEERMLSYIPKCKLVQLGDWDCPNPDFFLTKDYQYTFATFVFKKQM